MSKEAKRLVTDPHEARMWIEDMLESTSLQEQATMNYRMRPDGSLTMGQVVGMLKTERRVGVSLAHQAHRK